MTLYRRAQALMKEGKRQEGYETATRAMERFIANDDDLAWLLLESIELEDRRVDVHLNMGPPERVPPEDGLIKPLSFRVWAAGDELRLLQIIDFEIGRFGGESITAGLGTTTAFGHALYETLPTNASYEEVRTAVLDVLKQHETE